MKKLNQIIDILEGLNVKELVVYDFEKSSPFYDYFIICTTNERQASAAINQLKKALEDDIRHVEGKDGGWVLIDANDVIVHLFKPEERTYYGFDQRLLGIKRVV
jgi:ribosome-associated protein